MTQQSEEWGPWIEHDGKGCPCKGMWVQAVDEDGERDENRAELIGYSLNHWYSNRPPHVQIVRYRIRKPRALSQLQEMVRDLPERIEA